MAARVLLLFAFTGLFASAWNSDRPGDLNSGFAVRDQIPPAVVENLQTTDSVAEPIVESTPIDPITSVEPVSATVSLDQLDVSNCRYPDGITPGSYRVVDQRGRTGWLLLTLDDLTSRGMLAGTDSFDMYVSREDHSTYYFIRVEPREVIATAPEGSTILR